MVLTAGIDNWGRAFEVGIIQGTYRTYSAYGLSLCVDACCELSLLRRSIANLSSK